MIRYIFRLLAFEPRRTLLTVTALAAVIAVILVLEGFYAGLLTQFRNAVLNRGSDLIVVQAGVANMTAARSILPQYTRARVEEVVGVKETHPLTGISVIYERDDVRTAMFLLIYDSAGGPGRIIEGSAANQARSIVLDRSISTKYDLEIGDPFIISDFEFRIAGFSDGDAAFFTPFGFARYDDLIDFYFESEVAADISTFPLLSFLLVDLEKDADLRMVAAAIELAVPEGDVFLPAELASEDESLGRVLFGPIMGLLVGVSYVIGALVTGIIMFAAVNARNSDFGVLKALGFSESFLGWSVLLEAVIVALFAIPFGILLADVIALIVELVAPLYLILVNEAGPLLRTSIACLLFAGLGALLPIRLVRGVDPVQAFGR